MSSIAFAFLAATLWGIAPLFGKLGITRADVLAAMTLRSSVVTALLWATLLFSGRFPYLSQMSAGAGFLIALEGVTASLLGQTAMYYALKGGQASTVTPISASFPLVTVFLAAAMLGEKLTPGKVVGAFLVVSGIIVLKRF